MSKQAAPFTLVGTAQYPDPNNPGAFLTDVNATDAVWAEDSGGAACTIDPSPIAAGVSTCLVTPATDLTVDTDVNVTGYATDQDGHATPISAYTFTVPAEAAPPSTDATQFTIVEQASAPAPVAAAAEAPAGDAPVAPTVESVNAAEEAARAAIPAPTFDPNAPPTVESINAAEEAARAAAESATATEDTAGA